MAGTLHHRAGRKIARTALLALGRARRRYLVLRRPATAQEAGRRCGYVGGEEEARNKEARQEGGGKEKVGDEEIKGQEDGEEDRQEEGQKGRQEKGCQEKDGQEENGQEGRE